MKNPRQLAGLGLVCVLLFAISLFPARLAFQLLAPDGVRGIGLRGTVWEGSAGVIELPGLALRDTEWDLSVARLLTGQLGADFKSRWNGGFAEGYAATGIFSDLIIRDTLANMTGAWLSATAGLPRVDGQIAITIDQLELDDMWPEHLVGVMSIQELSSTLIGVGQAGLLGNVIAEFDSSADDSADVITGLIRDEGGPLELDGTVTLQKPASYSLSVKVKPRPAASASLRQNLQFLGSADASGAYVFELSGSL